jgi:pyridoxal 5'-phosphate synthase pdxT subunit
VKRIGILTLQGDFQKHAHTFRSLGCETPSVRSAEDLGAVDALAIPGGESTTIGKLLVRFEMLEPLRRRISAGMPVFGTCAGMILLATEIEGSDQTRIGVLDIRVARNAYGRQVESFEVDVDVPLLGNGSVRGVFIRAPKVTHVGPEVEVLAFLEGSPVLVRQGVVLAASFHPELTADSGIHRYFASLV